MHSRGRLLPCGSRCGARPGAGTAAEHLSTAFATLYGKLTPQQQQTADTLFREAPAAASKKSARQ